MTLFTWMWLLAIKQFLSLTCPYTSNIGNVLNLLSLVGSVVFFVLVPFFAPHWWYLLIAIGIYLVAMLISPRIDPNAPHNDAFRAYSITGSFVEPVIVVLMYLSLFGVI